jgi:hypothetical protein
MARGNGLVGRILGRKSDAGIVLRFDCVARGSRYAGDGFAVVAVTTSRCRVVTAEIIEQIVPPAGSRLGVFDESLQLELVAFVAVLVLAHESSQFVVT